jgi:hypothetical protein
MGFFVFATAQLPQPRMGIEAFYALCESYNSDVERSFDMMFGSMKRVKQAWLSGVNYSFPSTTIRIPDGYN